MQREVSQSNNDDQLDFNIVIDVAPPQLKKPPMYAVVMLNDDYTPMDFVVQVLEIYFDKNRQSATQVMLQIHTKGKGLCGVYPRDIAETKAHMVNEFSQRNEHPLLCEVEPAMDD